MENTFFTRNLILICAISLGHDFMMLIATNGLLFSKGFDNSEGQLGLGDKNQRPYPCLIETLKMEKVSSVECGFKHTICRTSLGRVYSWGWGKNGQLGHESFDNELLPKNIKIQAGYGNKVTIFYKK